MIRWTLRGRNTEGDLDQVYLVAVQNETTTGGLICQDAAIIGAPTLEDMTLLARHVNPIGTLSQVVIHTGNVDGVSPYTGMRYLRE